MGYQVDLEHLDDVTARIGGLHGFLVESLREIDERIAGAQQNWNGESAAAHAQAHAEWVVAAEQVRAGIDAMRAAAAVAHQSYSTAVATNLGILGR